MVLGGSMVGSIGVGNASIPSDIRQELITGSAKLGVVPAPLPNSTLALNNTTNITSVVAQPPTYDPIMIFILIVIGIAILAILFNGFNREQRY